MPAKEWPRVVATATFWLWGEGAEREKVRKEFDTRGLLDTSLTKAQARQLADVLAHGNPFKTEKDATGTFELPTGNGDEKTKVWFQAPAKYRKKKDAAGIVIALCGGPPPDLQTALKTAQEEYSYFQGPVQQAGFFLLSPAWYGDPAPFIFGALEEAERRWNIDRNRVYMVGHSAGGVSCLMVAPTRPDCFAGIGPFVCGVEHGALLNSLGNVAVYHVLGLKDSPWILDTGRKNSQKLQEVGGPLKIVEKNGGHDVYPDECTKAIEWLAQHPRPFWSKDLRCVAVKGMDRRGYFWIDNDPDAESGRGGRATWSVKVTGNRIEVTGDGVDGFRLSDEIVDLDKPVTVFVDGTQVLERTVTRSLRFALEWVEQTGEFSNVAFADLRMPRPAEDE